MKAIKDIARRLKIMRGFKADGPDLKSFAS